MRDVIRTLRDHGIQPTPQRIAVAEFVLDSQAHPTADEVLTSVRHKCPTVSRATVYNTLNLFVEKGLLKPQILKEGTAVFDPNVRAHHHLIDERTGRVYDVPWEALRVTGEKALDGFEVREYHVVMKGRKKKGK
jgi:Fe2+ or Zn2+ uptake regulation protein